MTIAIWGFALGLPLLAFGAVSLFAPPVARRFAAWFESSRAVAAVMTAFAWAWAAYEIQIFGVNMFREFFVGVPVLWQLMQVLAFIYDNFWFAAPVLIYLTVAWMPKSLAVRALTGVLMLIPAELFKTTRLLLPPDGSSMVFLFVVTAYAGAVVGMYGMFYPWRLEKGLAVVQRTDAGARALGAACAALGASLATTGCLI
ncbi:MAG: hypothetical protein J6U17_00520 [Kiritimatiellae bacterium]|nr:hypothetical protein [Kiritimatiellia bacterium]